VAYRGPEWLQSGWSEHRAGSMAALIETAVRMRDRLPHRRVFRGKCRHPPARRFLPMYFKYHVFFCINQRDAGQKCCANHGSPDIQAYAKERIKALNRDGRGKIRINRAGCLDRCELGPCMVVYPDAVWYTYVDKSDIDEIIDSHLLHGRIVDRLKLGST
jgi:(2Fe-2S) ferredoxin